MGENMVESKEVYMAAYASEGVPTADHLKIRTVRLSIAVDSIPKDHLAVEILWISVDPYQRTQMSGLIDYGLHMPPFNLNQAITALGIGRVRASTDTKYKEGDYVFSFFFPVSEFCVVPSHSVLTAIHPSPGITFPHYLSCFGVAGFAAWVGIEVIGQAKAGSNVFISAAAGGVGLLAGQLAKLKGCTVIGSTGSDLKVKLLKEQYGYDDAFNYNKETDLDAALTKYFPKGIDVYFDNVGGEMLDAVLNHVNRHARIPLCGMISQYNKAKSERDSISNLFNAIGKEVKLEGFMVGSYMNHFSEFSKQMEAYLTQSKINFLHHIFHGIDSFLGAFQSMFSSSHFGKVIIQLKP